jgi:nucleoside-diphosphate-sugar epimerase
VSSFFNQFQLEYVINKERQAIVDSWPDSIDDNLARKDWNWKPKYDFNDAYDRYIIPSIRKYYN